MSAREVIARACFDPGAFAAARHEHESVDQWRSRAAEIALHAAGYRIICDDENHAPTVERCAEAADVFADSHDVAAIGASTDDGNARYRAGETALRRLATSIRSLIQEPKS